MAERNGLRGRERFIDPFGACIRSIKKDQLIMVTLLVSICRDLFIVHER